MANFDIVIDPGKIQSVRDVIFELERTFQADFVPDFLRTLDDTLPVQNVAFSVNSEKQQYEFDVGIGIKVGEEGEGEDAESKHLILGLAMTFKPDPATGKFPHVADFGARVEIPLEGDITQLVFEGAFTRKMGKSLVVQCNLVEEQGIPLHAIFGGVAP